VEVQSVTEAIARGTTDNIGAGVRAGQQVTIRGTVYPNRKAAADALDVSLGSVYKAIARGNTERLGLGRRLPDPVTVRGVTYDDPKAASDALGVSTATVYRARERGTEDNIGLRKTSGVKQPVTIGKHHWVSMSTCSRDLGCSHDWLRKTLKNGDVPALRRLISKVKIYEKRELNV